MQRKHLPDLALAGAAALIALFVYLLTLTPSLSYLSPDGSELATVPYILGVAHPPGYPLYTWLGFLVTHLLPLRDVAWRMNLLSALGATWGVGLTYLIARLLLPPARSPHDLRFQRASALAVSLALAFSPTLWSQALIAEVYAPNLALVTTTLLLLLLWARRPTPARYAAFALTFGLSLGTHLSDLGFAPAYALFTVLVLYQRRTPARTWLGTIAVGAVTFGLGALQYLWIPFRAAQLPPGLILGRRSPTTLAGLYAYTLGAFSNLRFAFPLVALPDRIVLYLYYLRQQFTWGGLLLGTVGLLTMPLVRPRRFLLLAGMYLAHLVFFLEYRAFDLEVFFIPAHLIWALWMALGWYGLYRLTQIAFPSPRFSRSLLARILGVVLALGIVLAQGLLPLPLRWAEADLSHDTAIDDFYARVWEVLPQDAVLLSPGGVFGFDVFYWRLAYHTRPDVLLPTLESTRPEPLPAERPLYATAAMLQRGGLKGRGQPTLPPEAWPVPVVLGEQPQATVGHRSAPLMLFAAQPTPPDWKVTALPADLTLLNVRSKSVTLVGVRLDPTTVESGGALHLTLYWRVEDPQRLLNRTPQLTLRLGDRDLARYTLGFGLLPRYAQEVGLHQGDLLAIGYDLVIPSTVVGNTVYPLQLVRPGGEVVTLGQVQVTDEQSPWERWLSAAQPK